MYLNHLDAENIEDKNTVVIIGEIIAVVSTDVKRICLNCKGDICVINDVVGKCTRCSSMLKLTKFNEKSFVKFIIEDWYGSTLTLCAYDEIVHKLAAACVQLIQVLVIVIASNEFYL